jgi:hypothetical protein
MKMLQSPQEESEQMDLIANQWCHNLKKRVLGLDKYSQTKMPQETLSLMRLKVTKKIYSSSFL